LTNIDEFLTNLEKTIHEFDETRGKFEEGHHRNMELFDYILKSKEIPAEQRTSSVLGKQIAHIDLAHWSGEILILRTLKILAINVKILEIAIDDIKRKFGLSGIAEENKNVEKVRELENEINTLKQEWQPYLDRIKQAFEFTARYFEDSR